MKFSTLGLAALTLSLPQLLSGQSDQSQPSAYQPPPNEQHVKPQAQPDPTTKSLPAAPDEARRTSAATSAGVTKSEAINQRIASQPAQPPQNQPAGPAAATANNAPRLRIQLASKDAKNNSTEKFAGDHVRASNGGDLGTLKDFLINRQSGQADFALISSGGLLGIGNKLRLVPTEALRHTGEKDEFSLNIDQDHWKELAPLEEETFKSGQFTISDSQRRQMARNFNAHSDASQTSGFYSATLTDHLIRASDLAGRDVRAPDGRLGKIDAVILDLSARNAQALIAPNKYFTGLKEKLLVPFKTLAISTSDDAHPQVSTLLTQADFQTIRTGSSATVPATSTSPAQPATTKTATTAAAPAPAKNGQPSTKAPSQNTAVASSTPPPRSNATPAASNPAAASSPAASQPTQKKPDPTVSVASDPSSANQGQNLSPTGTTSADAIPAGTDPNLLAAARAIRKAIDEDRALASTDVRVTPEEGKIVLRGRVNDQKTKTAIIETATHELKGWKINDQISVDTR